MKNLNRIIFSILISFFLILHGCFFNILNYSYPSEVIAQQKNFYMFNQKKLGHVEIKKDVGNVGNIRVSKPVNSGGKISRWLSSAKRGKSLSSGIKQ